MRSVLSKDIVNELRGGLTAFMAAVRISATRRASRRATIRARSRTPDGFAIIDADTTRYRLVHVERSELARGADLQHRRNADLAEAARTPS